MGIALIDIIIVNHNSTDYLIQCIRSIYDAAVDTIPMNICVHDNASREDTDVLLQKFPDVLLSKSSANIGFARAVNCFIGKTSAPYILILNPDTKVHQGFFESLLAFMENHPQVGITGPKIYEKNGMIQGSARAFPTPLTGVFGRSSLLTRWLPNNRISGKNILVRKSSGQFMKVDWVSGACMLVRRAAVEDVGMLDERFFLYWEDADWCKRMSQKKWDVVYYQHASIMHYTGISSRKKNSRPLLEFHKSAYHYFCKHSPLKKISIVKLAVFGAISLRFYGVLVLTVLKQGRINT